MENGNRNKDIQEKKTLANYKNIDITDIITMYIPSSWSDDFNIIIVDILCRKIQIASKTIIRRKL